MLQGSSLSASRRTTPSNRRRVRGAGVEDSEASYSAIAPNDRAQLVTVVRTVRFIVSVRNGPQSVPYAAIVSPPR